jgi:hypothetical protein
MNNIVVINMSQIAKIGKNVDVTFYYNMYKIDNR